jgi:hypothetical protein
MKNDFQGHCCNNETVICPRKNILETALPSGVGGGMVAIISSI